MKTFIITIEIEGFRGNRTQDLEIKAMTAKSAKIKAFDVIGNRLGKIITMKREGA